MEKIHVFLDESGAFGFDFSKPNTPSHMVIAAVLIKESNLEYVTQEAESIRKKEFQTGEMKSKNIGKNMNRRKRILEKILALPITVAYLIIDKKQIDNSSALTKYKKSYYKFCYQILYTSLVKAIPNISIHADNIGETDDLKEFSNYFFKRNNSYTLFSEFDFAFSNSQVSVLVQIADIIAGTIWLHTDETKKSDFSNQNFIKLIDNSTSLKEVFPKTQSKFIESTNFGSSQDKFIAELALNLVDKFLATNSTSNDMDIKQQIAVVQYLKFRFISNQFRRYIPTKELINHLANLGFKRMSIQTFRTKIIANLRDFGLIIASSTQGYKFPCKIAEVYDFINISKNIIFPMLNRLRICNNTIKTASSGEINLYERTDLKLLAELLNDISNNN